MDEYAQRRNVSEQMFTETTARRGSETQLERGRLEMVGQRGIGRETEVEADEKVEAPKRATLRWIEPKLERVVLDALRTTRSRELPCEAS